MSMISDQSAANCQRRKRKSKVTNNIEKFKDWKAEEKCQLLQALKKYGHLDMKNLCKSVPTKNKGKIKLFINFLWVTANKSSADYKQIHYSKRRRIIELEKLSVIDKWLHLLLSAQPKQKYNEIKSLPIAKAFFFISKLEKHPDPVSCNGIDFGALYEMLYNVICGYPIKNMDTPTSQFLLESFKEMEQDIKQQDIQKRIQFLYDLKSVKYADSYNGNVLPDLKNVGKCLMALSRMQGYNPLGIPGSLLRLIKCR